MWKAYTGAFGLFWGPKKASQVLSEGAVCDLTSGYVTVAAIAVMSHLGVCGKTVTATDSDYASTTRIPVQVAKSPQCKWKASVLSTDTLLTTHVGTYADLAGSPVGSDITIATSADDAALITDYVNDNEALVQLNSAKAMQSGIGTT